MKVKLNGSNKFQPNLEGTICILATKKTKKKKKKSNKGYSLKRHTHIFPFDITIYQVVLFLN